MRLDGSSGVATPAKSCPHEHRMRDGTWGWFSAETVCSGCGEAFDPVEEAELRTRMHPDLKEPRTAVDGT
jgi:hypothetical protein